MHTLILSTTVVKTVTNETVTKEDLGGSKVHTSKSGVAHGAFANDIEALRAMRKLLDFLPSSHDKSTLPVKSPCTDPWNRLVPEVERLVPDDPNTPYDVKDVMRQIVDHGDLFEIMPVRTRCRESCCVVLCGACVVRVLCCVCIQHKRLRCRWMFGCVIWTADIPHTNA
jgi:hypothetical protein